MFKRVLGAAVVLGFLATPALAYHCPVDVGKIDAALAGSHGLSETQVPQVESLRNEGQELHNAGNHDEALDKLHEAMEILGLEHE